VPSFEVSPWIPRFKEDGFDGIELWEFHYTLASEEERERLVDASGDIPIYNSYVGFEDADAPARHVAIEAIKRLGVRGVKYNLGKDVAKLGEYRRNLLAWESQLPDACTLLCECHFGTVVEDPETIAAFFADLPSERFGVILHLDPGAEMQSWFNALGPRIRHVHVQMRRPDGDPAVPENVPAIQKAYADIVKNDFQGAITMEFSRGIGQEENIEEIYANVCADLAFARSSLAEVSQP
jgi:sugar phosphate isomerase/epimerase